MRFGKKKDSRCCKKQCQVELPDRKLRLVMVGSGVELPRLQENAARLGIADASVFMPAQRNVAHWMRAMDIFVLPSRSESFSNSLLEAMACGCCVVGSRCGRHTGVNRSKFARSFV